MIFGFSTGSIALDDVRRGMNVATHQRAKAIELSALREEELDPLLNSLDELQDDLSSIDPTMQEAEAFLQCFRDRLRQVHISYVNSQSRHERLNYESIMAYRRVAHWLDGSVPVILETPVERDEVDEEISAAQSVFAAAEALFQNEQQPEKERQQV